MSDTSVRTSGPMFDGRAKEELRDGIEAVRHDVAKRGRALAAAAFAGAIRDNHGKFIGSIQVITESHNFTSHSGHHTYTMPIEVPTEADVVTTDIATYGPWLEGTGSRNDTTRFKGYFGFRKAADELDRVAGTVAEGTIRPYVDRMN